MTQTLYLTITKDIELEFLIYKLLTLVNLSLKFKVYQYVFM